MNAIKHVLSNLFGFAINLNIFWLTAASVIEYNDKMLRAIDLELNNDY